MEKSVFSFDSSNHTYYLDEEAIPSVTQLADIYNTTSFAPDSDMELVLDAAAERGTVLHGYIEHRLSGGDRWDYEIPTLYWSYMDSVDLFLAEHELSPVLVENPMWGEVHGIRFAGTPDCIGEFDGVLSILDWKFVSQVQKTKVCAQLNGYLALCAANGIFPEKLFCVQFLSDGAYRLYPSQISHKCFDICVDVYRLKSKRHPRGGISCEPV